MPKKLTIKDMKYLAKKQGGKCLSTKYIYNNTKLEWECIEGHKWLATPNDIQQGTWCRKCSYKKMGDKQRCTIGEMQDLWNAQEYFFKVNKNFERLPVTTCNIVGEAKSSVSSWACPVFTFATKGNYVGTLSGVIESGSAAQDDSSNSIIYTAATVSLRTNACSASS